MHQVFNPVQPAKADLSIDFIIVGAGVTGLACAVALSRAGHRVQVFEKNRDHKTSRGCRVPAVETKILYEWGLRHQLEEVSCPQKVVELACLDGTSLGLFAWYAPIFEEVGAPAACMHETVLREILLEAARSYGAQVKFDAEVVAIDPEDNSVTLRSTQVHTADVIVGADGLFGITRREILEGDETRLDCHGVLYNCVVPRQKLLADPELESLVKDDGRIVVWFGEGNTMMGWPVAPTEAQDWCAQIYIAYEGEWDKSTSLPPAQANMLPPCDSRFKKLVEMGRAEVMNPVTDYPKLADWVHDDAAILVVGNAAHQISPGAFFTTSLGIEDAAVLAKLFSHLTNHSQINSFLEAFQELRQERRRSVSEREVRDLGIMASSPEQVMDEALTAMAGFGLVHADGPAPAEAYEEIKAFLGYDAEDAADEWWTAWGVLRERAKIYSMAS